MGTGKRGGWKLWIILMTCINIQHINCKYINNGVIMKLPLSLLIFIDTLMPPLKYEPFWRRQCMIYDKKVIVKLSCLLLWQMFLLYQEESCGYHYNWILLRKYIFSKKFSTTVFSCENYMKLSLLSALSCYIHVTCNDHKFHINGL